MTVDVSFRRELAVVALTGWDRTPTDQVRRLVGLAAAAGALDRLLTTPGLLTQVPAVDLLTALLHAGDQGRSWAHLLTAAGLPDAGTTAVDHGDRLRFVLPALVDVPESTRAAVAALGRSPADRPAGPPRWSPDWTTVPTAPRVHLGEGSPSLAALPGPDGRVLVAGADNAVAVRLWDPVTGRPVGAPVTYDDRVSGLAAVVVPGGPARLAVGCGTVVRLTDPLGGRSADRLLRGHRAAVTTVTAVPLPDGRALVVTGARDGTVRSWRTGRTVTGSAPLAGHRGPVRAVAALPGPHGQMLVVSAGEDGVRLWEPTGGEALGVLDGTPGARAVLVVPAPDGRPLVAVAGADPSVRVWDPTTGALVLVVPHGHHGQVSVMAQVPAPDGTLLATGSTDATVRLWTLDGRPVGSPLTGHDTHLLTAVAVPGSDGRSLLVTGGRDRTLLWGPPTGATRGEVRSGPAAGHTGAVRSVVPWPAPDGRLLLATVGQAETVRLWDLDTGRPAGPVTGPRSDGAVHTVKSLVPVPVPDGRTLLATGSGDRTVRLWDPTTGRQVGRPLVGHTGSVDWLAALPTGHGGAVLVSGATDGTVRVWDPSTGRRRGRPLDLRLFGLDRGGSWEVLRWDTRSASYVYDAVEFDLVRSMAVVPVPGGRPLLALGDDKGTVRFYDPIGRRPVGRALTGHTSQVWALAAATTPGGRTVVVSASQDGSVRLWDATTRTQRGVLPLHGQWLTSLATVPAPDGGTLVAAPTAAGVRLWDPVTGDERGILGCPGHVGALCGLPDGRIAVGYESQVAVLRPAG